jgi:hypothetical protein
MSVEFQMELVFPLKWLPRQRIAVLERVPIQKIKRARAEWFGCIVLGVRDAKKGSLV